MLRFVLAGLVGAVLLLGVSACGGGDSKPAASEATSATPTCPAQWRADWQGLANRIKAPVYCPGWLPAELEGAFAGSPFNGQTVDPDRSYLIKYLWYSAGLPGAPEEVHVNFRGQPGNPRMPQCDNSEIVAGKVVHHVTPCFSDPKGQKRFGPIRATLYTSNQGADQWHLLYAWRHRGSFYSVSEHVAPPYTYKQVLAHVDRMMRSLVLIQPAKPAQT